MHEDPDRETGYLPEMDCRKPEVRKRYEDNTNSMLDHDVANIWFWSNRCRSYS